MASFVKVIIQFQVLSLEKQTNKKCEKNPHKWNRLFLQIACTHPPSRAFALMLIRTTVGK